MIELDHVSKSYDRRPVLEPTTLRVEAGRTHVLIGPSGCGKSTVLRLMLGLIRPDRGTVRLAGEPVRPETARKLRHGVGYVVQDGGLFPHLSAGENAALLARHLGWDAARIRKRLREMAELVHLPPDSLERYPVQLSGGQRQRVGLVRALMLDPPVLLMDEPLGALDPVVRARLQDDLRELFRTLRKTVVLVTHDMAEAAFLGDTISLMRAGRVLQTGPLSELLERPADPYVTEFISAQRRGWPEEVA
ncbi:MAG: ATP-binding cassette domain-containing protein [Armatimonadota bacterium]